VQPLALAYFRLIVLHRLFTLYGSALLTNRSLQIIQQHLGRLSPLAEEDTGDDVLLWYLLWGARYTGQEYDPETGFYYYGARYYDPRVSTWVSTDPALDQYLPTTQKDDQPDHENLPGLGGVYNSANLSIYHYAGLNPLKYFDPDGRILRFAPGSSKEFIKTTKAHLNELRQTKTGRALIRQLEKSENVFHLVEDKREESMLFGSETIPDKPENAKNGEGTGAMIGHNPKARPVVPTVKGEKPTKPSVALGHELAHAADMDKGTVDTRTNPKTGLSEHATKVIRTENKIRSQMRPKEPARLFTKHDL